MIKKGLVVECEKEYAIVINKTGDCERILRREGLAVGKKIMYTQDDVVVYDEARKKGRNVMTPVYRMGALVASMILVILMSGILRPVLDEDVVDDEIALITSDTKRIISVDINPSFKIEVDGDNIVLNIEAMNEDALTLDVDDLIGMASEDAIEGIVALAEEAGFIDISDLEEDYVLITYVLGDGVIDEQDEAALLVKKDVSTILSSINLAIARATEEELAMAEERLIPVGLMVNGVEASTTVKEYFGEESNVASFSENNVLAETSAEHRLSLIDQHLESLSEAGSLKMAFKQEYLNQEAAYTTLREQYLDAVEDYEAGLSGGGEIDDDQLGILEETSKSLKNQLDDRARQIGSTKEELRMAIEVEAKHIPSEDQEVNRGNVETIDDESDEMNHVTPEGTVNGEYGEQAPKGMKITEEPDEVENPMEDEEVREAEPIESYPDRPSGSDSNQMAPEEGVLQNGVNMSPEEEPLRHNNSEVHNGDPERM